MLVGAENKMLRGARASLNSGSLLVSSLSAMIHKYILLRTRQLPDPVVLSLTAEILKQDSLEDRKLEKPGKTLRLKESLSH